MSPTVKYGFLCVSVLLLGCRYEKPGAEKPQSSSEVADVEVVPDTLLFEGRTFVSLNDSVYEATMDGVRSVLVKYADGTTKSIEHYEEDYCGVPGGIHRFFDRDGTVQRELVHYIWAEGGDEGSCDFSIVDCVEFTFYSNGKLKSRQVYREPFQGTRKAIGLWQEFDEDGNLVSSRNYGGSESVVNVLDVSFLERLEAGWSNGNLNSMLAKKGFVPMSQTVDFLKFAHPGLGLELQIRRSSQYEARTFSAVFYVTKDYLETYRSLLQNSGYLEDKNSREGVAAYRKKGLGSYESKTIQLHYNENKILYNHHIGKELSMPTPEYLP